MNFRLFSLLMLASLGSFSMRAQQSHPLDTGWQFVPMHMANGWEVFRPVQPGKPESVPQWETVTLPHCYNAFDAVDPDRPYYQGAAWYRTRIKVQNPYPGGHTFLCFDGAGQRSDLWIGTQRLARHVGGYDKWKVDITTAAKEHFSKNPADTLSGLPIAVECDNSRNTETIPSDLSDFCLYDGLYRRVWLRYEPAVFIDSLRITATPQRVTVRNVTGGQVAPNATLTLVLLDPKGKEVERKTATPGQLTTFILRTPHLWSPDSPQRYTLRATLQQGAVKAEKTERFGIRTFRFEKHGPFYLNGKRLLLRGTHRHEDHAGLGAAMPDSLIDREMKMIKAMGANFIRLGHYQQNERVLTLCDSLGLLVWEEIPWCRGGVGGSAYKEQAFRMLNNMIVQHGNHPSVILWGIGNENDWPGDFPHFSTDSVRLFMSQLNQLAHRLDSTRLTVIRRCDFAADIPDVYSPSIWAGWYSKRFTDYRSMSEEARKKYPRFLHAEWGGDSHAGRMSEGPFNYEAGDRNGDWSESYICRLFDYHLTEQESMPLLTGSAFWTFKDFATPLRPRNPIPYVNQKGVVQRDGTPKESFYVFQSHWAKQPMLHIFGHDNALRWGKSGTPLEVPVYSNCDEVELFLNNRSLGKKQRNAKQFPAQGLTWQVTFEEGQNVLRAVGKSKRRILTDTLSVSYTSHPWGKAVKVVASAQKLSNGHFLVTATLVDSRGIRCLDERRFLRFEAAGDGHLLHHLGTRSGSSLIEAQNGAAFITAEGKGPFTVAVKAEGLPATLVNIYGE